MRTNCLIKSFLLAGLILPTAMRADEILNGGFETTGANPVNPGGILYSAFPWFFFDPNILPFSDESMGVCLTTSCGAPFGPHSGNAYFFGGAWYGTDGANRTLGTLSQTVFTTPRTSYQLSFWLAQPVAGTSTVWAVKWDGTDLEAVDGSGVFPYEQFVFTVTSNAFGLDNLEFDFFDNAPVGQLAGYELDDVSVVPSAGVTSFSVIPEPGSGVLVTMVFAVAGLVVVFKKRFSRLGSPRVREDS
jgi:hypothetical protein